MAKVHATLKTEVEISFQEIMGSIRKELSLDGYKIIDSTVMKLGRSGWDGYDYSPVKSGFSEKKLEALRSITTLEKLLGIN